ncbi:Bug family tripartite tricarboxylate transporter substrate binding protein [Pseudorhodoferax sp.]|uniref:Bug family tripartite tricarboxylate transporter substrate binding protein n=1 Tax=Pseudorhodoferax sp. TaxID=1993553 RepID=UPI0039E23CA0
MKLKACCLVVGCLLSSVTSVAHAFPDRPVTIIVPFGAGTAVDVNGRDFAQALGSVMSQPVVIDNRAGAEGVIGAMAVLHAPADGHVVMFTSSSIPVLDPLMKKGMQFDPLKDFTPICTVGRTSNVVNITGSSPIKSAAELIEAAKSQPGKLTFAYSSATTRLAGELFQQAAGIKLTGVPYKASSAGLTDAAGGQVDLFFIDDVSAAPFYQSGKLRPLVVSGSERIRALPDTPSAAEIGVPGYQIQPWFGVYASARTPPATVARLREIMAQAMQTPVAAANVGKRGLSVHVVCGDAMSKFQLDEAELWRGVLKKAGIDPQ